MLNNVGQSYLFHTLAKQRKIVKISNDSRGTLTIKFSMKRLIYTSVLPSGQSLSPSQTKVAGIHFPFEHWNCLSVHVWSPTKWKEKECKQ